MKGDGPVAQFPACEECKVLAECIRAVVALRPFARQACNLPLRERDTSNWGRSPRTRRLVQAAIRDWPGITRQELAAMTGLPDISVANAIKALSKRNEIVIQQPRVGVPSRYYPLQEQAA